MRRPFLSDDGSPIRLVDDTPRIDMEWQSHPVPLPDRGPRRRRTTGYGAESGGQIPETTARGDIDARISRAEHRLRCILDAIPIPLTVIDSEGQIELWNPAAAAIAGRSADEVLGRHPETVLPELTPYIPEVARLLANGPVHDLPLEWTRADGSRAELSAHCALIDDPEGGLDAVVGAAFDVGPLRDRERRIARLNRVYEVLGQIDSAIFRVRDRETLLAEVCRIAVEVGGFVFAWIGEADAAGDVHVAASHGPAPSFLARGSVSARAGEPEGDGPLGTAIREDRPIIRQDVEHEEQAEPRRSEALARGFRSTAAFPIHLSGRAIAAMKLYSSQLGFFDAEEVRLLSDVADHLSFALEAIEAERLRQAAEARYRNLFERNPQAMWVSDPESGRILAVNDAAVAAYGYPRDQFLVLTIADLLVPQDDDSPAGAERCPDPSPTRGQKHRGRGGSVKEVEVIGHEIEFEGRLARISMISDITERRQLEARLREAAKLEAVGQLAGGIAHDFNNVLAAVVGYGELLVAELGADPRAEDAREIVRAGNRAGDLTRQLLAFARRQVLVPRPIDANEVVAAITPMLCRLIGENITLETKLATSPAVVEVDPTQLEQVLVNLVVNARDAMPNGGLVRLTVAFQGTSARRRHRLSEPAVLLNVADTGSGMTREVLSHVFEPFYSTKASKGTGLGLATAHGIVTQSGGEIWAESSPGVGTKFSILLPRSQREPIPLTVPERGAVPRSPGARILVVEDDPAVRRYMERTLEREGFAVLVAASPRQAEALVTAGEDIDLVLVDLVLPGGNGADLAQRLLTLRPKARLVYMSGYDPGPTLQLVPGRDRFLAKPFGPAELLDCVRGALAGAKAR
jgi:two-component system cell cycle sensor histidine kinase/response regulator CckA